MKTDLLALAIANNISWCSRVCALHGSDICLTNDVWVNRRSSPPFYPNIITRMRVAQEEVIRAIQQCREAGLHGSIGIKDSFDDLDLSAAGFDKVISGQWYGISEFNNSSSLTGDWRKIGRAEFASWLKAWNSENDPVPDIFRTDLLADPDVMFMAQYSAGQITAGAIADFSNQVIGLSNWFSVGEDASILQNAIRMAHSIKPFPLVCWSSDPQTTMEYAGFAPIGPMSVWIARLYKPPALKKPVKTGKTHQAMLLHVTPLQSLF